MTVCAASDGASSRRRHLCAEAKAPKGVQAGRPQGPGDRRIAASAWGRPLLPPGQGHLSCRSILFYYLARRHMADHI
eukprot:3754837-Pyramimonas_sp.AAC.1